MEAINVEHFLMAQIQLNTAMLELVQRRSAMARMEQDAAAAGKRLEELENVEKDRRQLEAERDELAAEKKAMEDRYNDAVCEVAELKLQKQELVEEIERLKKEDD